MVCSVESMAQAIVGTERLVAVCLARKGEMMVGRGNSERKGKAEIGVVSIVIAGVMLLVVPQKKQKQKQKQKVRTNVNNR